MTMANLRALSDLTVGVRARISRICGQKSGVPGAVEVEQRLLEMGFAEGEELEVLHHGPIGRDPIAVRIGETVLAVRRSDAQLVLVED